MATVDVISLLSSPARASHVDVFDVPMSSSPLPSPSELFGTRARLRPGNRATPIPKNATSSFTAAAQSLQAALTEESSTNKEAVDMIQNSRVPRGHVTNEEDVPAEIPKPKPTRKPRTKKVTETAKPTEKKPRKSRAKKVETEVDKDVLVKEKPVRKPRAKKTDVEKQSRIPKGKVTKTTAASTAGKEPRKTKAATVSDKVLGDKGENILAPLQLEKASRRRRDWTPVEETLNNTVVTTPQTLDTATTYGDTTSEKANGFVDLLGTFGYGDKEPTAPKPVIKATGTRKRKLIELVRTGESTKELQPVAKPKAARKRPRTITDLATSAYAVENEDESSGSPAPLLQYFSLETGNQPERTKSRSRSPAKRATKTTKGKNGVTVPVLLSPKSALKELDKQDFVFGTSSQLAREDSPTLLRDLHQAMLASNRVDDDPFADWRAEPSAFKPPTIGRRAASYEGKRSLWAASARGLNGDLMGVEIVDLSESPMAEKAADIPAVPAVQSLKSPELKNEDIWHDVDDLCSLPTTSQADLVDEALRADEPTLPELDKHSGWQDIDEMDLTSPAPLKIPSKPVGPVEAAIRSRLQNSPPKSTKRTINSLASFSTKAKASPASKKSKVPTLPDYSTYTTTQLSSEISSYGFKPVKSRDKMILLLERCWIGRQRLANPDFSLPPPSAQPSPSPKISPKRSSTRSRKAVAGSDDEESDMPLSQLPRKPKGRNSKSRTTTRRSRSRSRSRSPSPRAKKTSRVKTRESPPSAELQRAIMQAVIAAPRSMNDVTPSWHEKMLLYDPIVIEEFTAWLNSEALNGVGWDKEVAENEVKAWCEARSVCCLWKENLRNGGAIKKY